MRKINVINTICFAIVLSVLNSNMFAKDTKGYEYMTKIMDITDMVGFLGSVNDD